MEVKRLAFLHYSYPGIGGTEAVSNTLCDVFEEYGIACSFISWKKVAQENGNSSRIFYMPDEENIDSKLNTEALRLYVLNNNIDVIINQGPFWGGWNKTEDRPCKVISVLHYAPSFRIDNMAYQIERLYSIRKSLSLRNRLIATIRKLFKPFFVKRDFKINERQNMCRIVYNSDVFLLICTKYIEEFKRIYAIDNKCQTLFYAIANPLSIRGDRTISEKKKNTVVYVGRLTGWDKRVDRLLKIWSKVTPSNPEWNLVICGDGEEREALMLMSNKLGLNNNVKFKGFCNPTDLYKEASIACLTSTSEAWGMVLLEASTYGVVPMAYNVSTGIQEIIKDGYNGFLIKAFDETEYIRSLQLLMQDNLRREEMSAVAMKMSLQYDSHQIVKRWQDLFAKL